MLAVGAAASHLGVAVPTLRSWDRRCGLGPSQHGPGQHRRYTSEDLARLGRMITLTGEGFPRRQLPVLRCIVLEGAP